MGGSQGSAAINKALAEVIPKLLLNKVNIIWQTGKNELQKYQSMSQKGVYIFDFSTSLSSYSAISNFALTRAGALTLAELEADKLPALLIPYPYAAGNHQFLNARQKKHENQAEILEQKDLTADSLYQKLIWLKDNLETFAQVEFSSLHKNAAKLIVESILAKIE